MLLHLSLQEVYSDHLLFFAALARSLAGSFLVHRPRVPSILSLREKAIKKSDGEPERNPSENRSEIKSKPNRKIESIDARNRIQRIRGHDTTS